LYDEKLQLHLFIYLFWKQHVTVGVVGGSDLVKITEKLVKTGDEHRRSIIALMMNSATLEVIGLSFFFCDYVFKNG